MSWREIRTSDSAASPDRAARTERDKRMATPVPEVPADTKTDRLYRSLRDRHGSANARANGYRFHAYFLGEQETVLAAVDGPPGIVLDIACGSGLMVQPLAARGWHVVGVDFNEQACRAARQNGIAIARGNALNLPLAKASVDRAVSCQFLNQQTPERARQFVLEAARVLKPGGRLIVVWRNGRSLIHRVAHWAYSGWDRWRGRPDFPQVFHGRADIRAYAEEGGLEVAQETVTLPLLRWQSDVVNGLPAKLFGASFFVILRKPGDAANRATGHGAA